MPVYTTLGHYLGRVVGIEVDPATHQVTHYQVLAAAWLPRLWRKRLMVAPAQVVSLTKQAMVVADNITAEPAAEVRAGLAPEPTS